MALTLAVEQRLQDAGLVDLFDQHLDMWTDVARRALAFVKTDFPNDAIVRHDDVAQALIGVIEVNEVLRAYLNAEKLRGKFWKTHFAHLITDRTWNLISGVSGD